MGDEVEITSWPKHQRIFYPISSSAVMFDVKAAANAVVGLARKPGSKCEYWICIGDNNARCWIKEDGKICSGNGDKSTPHILSMDEFRRFWIKWSDDNVQLGRDGETKPIVNCYTIDDRMHNFKYVTYGVLGENNPVHWKLVLPPLLDNPKSPRAVSGGKPYWVPTEHQLPDDAMIGGFENETLYVIRAFHRGSLTPGKFVPSEGTGYIPWGGAANEKGEFEVLCGFDCIWVPSRENRIPVGAVEGGYSELHNERLFVGRAMHEGHLIPGKVQPSHKVCYISYEDKEIAKKVYEILVEPNVNSRCVSTVLYGYAGISVSDNDDDEEEDESGSWQDHEDDDDDDDDHYDSNDEVYAF